MNDTITAVMALPGGGLSVADVAAPRLETDRVLVRIAYGGICGSDLHYAATGRNGAYTIEEPLVLGHEVVGVIEAIGQAAEGAATVGDRVAVHPATPTPPPGGHEGAGLNLATDGTYLGSASTRPHTHGGFVSLLSVSPEQLRVLPDGLDLERAVLAEPLSIALHGVSRLGGRVAGARVLVSGAGPIGSLAVAALRAAGAETVVAADLQEFPLSVARSIGADDTIRLGAGVPIEDESFDLAVEAAGVTASLSTCLSAVRRGGAVLQLGILPAGALTLPLAGLVSKELTLLGSQRFDVEMDAALELLAARPEIGAVVSHRYRLDEAGLAFETASDSSRSAKVVLDMR